MTADDVRPAAGADPALLPQAWWLDHLGAIDDATVEKGEALTPSSRTGRHRLLWEQANAWVDRLIDTVWEAGTRRWVNRPNQYQIGRLSYTYWARIHPEEPAGHGDLFHVGLQLSKRLKWVDRAEPALRPLLTQPVLALWASTNDRALERLDRPDLLATYDERQLALLRSGRLPEGVLVRAAGTLWRAERYLAERDAGRLAPGEAAPISLFGPVFTADDLRRDGALVARQVATFLARLAEPVLDALGAAGTGPDAHRTPPVVAVPAPPAVPAREPGPVSPTPRRWTIAHARPVVLRDRCVCDIAVDQLADAVASGDAWGDWCRGRDIVGDWVRGHLVAADAVRGEDGTVTAMRIADAADAGADDATWSFDGFGCVIEENYVTDQGWGTGLRYTVTIPGPFDAACVVPVHDAGLITGYVYRGDTGTVEFERDDAWVSASGEHTEYALWFRDRPIDLDELREALRDHGVDTDDADEVAAALRDVAGWWPRPESDLEAAATADTSPEDGPADDDDEAMPPWVCVVAPSPDGRWLASGDDAGIVRVRALEGDDAEWTIEQPPHDVRGVAWSPDGRWLAIATAEGAIELWEPLGDAPVRTLHGHEGEIWSIAFSPDGRSLASASFDQTVRIWDVADGREARTLRGHKALAWCVAWSPDGRWLATSAQDGLVLVWDARQGRLVRPLELDGAWARSLAWSPDGQWLATGTDTRAVQLWRPITGGPAVTLAETTDWVMSLAWSPDGSRLAGATDDLVIVWDVPQRSAALTLRGHDGPVGCVCWSPEGSWLASGGADGSVRIWDAHAGAPRAVFGPTVAA